MKNEVENCLFSYAALSSLLGIASRLRSASEPLQVHFSSNQGSPDCVNQQENDPPDAGFMCDIAGEKKLLLVELEVLDQGCHFPGCLAGNWQTAWVIVRLSGKVAVC